MPIQFDGMKKTLGLTLLFLVMAASLMASPPPPVPEIDPGTGLSALALLSGGFLVLRAVRKR
jgi:hypothetical protein